MTAAFDLDGVLVDSEEMIRECYRIAGAEPPDGFFSLGHHRWLEDEAVHAKKDAAYLRRIRAGRWSPLPSWQTARMLKEDGHVVSLISGAPPGTAQALDNAAPYWPFSEALCGLSATAKTLYMLSKPEGGVYVDDQEYVTVPRGWRRVLYTGQSAQDLYDEVTG